METVANEANVTKTPNVNERNINALLYQTYSKDATDLILIPDSKPHLKIQGELISVDNVPTLPAKQVKNLIYASMTPWQLKAFEEHKEIDYSYTLKDSNGGDICRFRVNAYTASGNVEAVFRLLKNKIKSLRDLRLPERIIQSFAEYKEGLILVAGSTGAGKSTTLTSFLDYINENYNKRIITIEDPVEVIHKNKKSIFSQREVGVDTESFDRAIKSSLRQSPDIIFIGEIRDINTARIALIAAQTGHLVVSTIHAGSADETVQRFLNLYPDAERDDVRSAFSTSLKAVLVQQLVLDVDNRNLPALEVMIVNDRIQRAIVAQRKNGGFSNDTVQESITSILASSSVGGSISMDNYLMKLVTSNQITPNEAIEHALNPMVMRQQLSRHGNMG